ncbi:MAG: MltA domain-containing protein [Elusimicrobiales bacterium]|nr:MltA domain-containing protein [Elusimicrobiales bacterium]
MKLSAFILLVLLPAAAFSRGPWYAPQRADIILPSPDQPADTLDSCPKLNSLKAAEEYTDAPAVKEVAEVDGIKLPLPADDLERAGILEILKTDLDYWNARPDSAKIQLGPDAYDAARLRATIKALTDLFSAGLPPEELLAALKSRFRIYRASADDGTGKTVITGYYEAEIQVTKTPDETHKYAVHLKPADLVKTTPAMGVDFDYGRFDEAGKLVQHYSRQEIHSGKLSGQGLELVWSAHPSQIMLLQIQGSGVLRFPDGDYLRAGFDGANGHPFRSVQKILIDCGEIPGMSFKDFIKYLSEQGPREERLADLNPRYIFFKSRPKDSLPYGAIGRALTAGRSIAIDPKYVPLGLFGLLKSKRPVAQGAGVSFKDFNRFISTHDTGSAIRGPGRVDLFWGTGSTAETEASSMKAPGELYLFIIK